VEGGAEEFDRAAVGRNGSGENLHQSALAGTVFSDKSMYFSPGDIEIDAVKGDRCSE
jgi:hypothetical protein